MISSLGPQAIVIFVVGIVVISMLGAAWSQWLEHKQRSQALEVIKAALQAGKEPPAVVYEQFAKAGQAKAPWGEVVVFTALGFGFWIAYAQTPPEEQMPYLVIASTMTVTALGCLGLALMRPGGGSKDDDDAG